MVEEAKEESVVISPEHFRFTAAISKASLLAGRNLAHTRSSVYRGSREGSIDGWILVMRCYLRRTQSKASLDHHAWSITGYLAGNYIINNAESERDTPEKLFELLSSRFWKLYASTPGVSKSRSTRKGRLDAIFRCFGGSP